MEDTIRFEKSIKPNKGHIYITANVDGSTKKKPKAKLLQELQSGVASVKPASLVLVQ